MTPQFLSLRDTMSAYVHDGMTVALEGFTHLIPFAAGHELIRQRRRGLTLVRMTPDLIYDQMIGMGCAEKLVFSWGGNPGVGSLHRLRDAIEKDWPHPLTIDEHSHAGMAVRYTAGASGLPFGILKGYTGTSLVDANREHITSITCPFTGEAVTAVPALIPDVTILHAQQADVAGNVLMRGIVGASREAAMAARTLVFTVEQVVDDLDAPMNAFVIPAWQIAAIAEVPGGAYPSYAQGYYARDNAFYQAWDAIARSRDDFVSWMTQHVLGTLDHAEFLRSVGAAD
ncbi:MAG: CoA transferase subunit A [Gemmatimonadaceae bacterium]|nr:CoA transferase subunit A [Gemmatimonadaceae bacterium]